MHPDLDRRVAVLQEHSKKSRTENKMKLVKARRHLAQVGLAHAADDGHIQAARY